MRLVFFLLVLGFFWTLGSILFSIWFVAVVLAILFFAVRGIRHFIRASNERRMLGYPPRHYRRWLHSVRERPSACEPLVPMLRPLHDEWAEERIIPVE